MALLIVLKGIMKDAGGRGARNNQAKRKLNIFGELGGRCGLANDPAKLEKLKNRTMLLAASIGEIHRLEKVTDSKKKEAEIN